jgi:hypothetical protein
MSDDDGYLDLYTFPSSRKKIRERACIDDSRTAQPYQLSNRPL